MTNVTTTATTVSSSWEAQAIQAALALKDLPDDWDRPSSEKPTPTAINGALSCIGQVAGLNFSALPRPFLAPLDDGSVQLEWDQGDRHLDIQITPDGGAVYVIRCGGEINEYDDPTKAPSLEVLFGRLMAARG